MGTKVVDDGSVLNVHHDGVHIGNIFPDSKNPSSGKNEFKSYSKHWRQKNFHKTKKDAVDWLVKTHKTAENIKEDGEGGVPANNIGSGHVAGYDPMLGKKILRRKFAGEEVFVVDEERFHKARLGKKKYAKYEDYVGNDELGEAIRVYGRENYGRAIILQNENTGAMMYLRYGTVRAPREG